MISPHAHVQIRLQKLVSNHRVLDYGDGSLNTFAPITSELQNAHEAKAAVMPDLMNVTGAWPGNQL